MLRVEVVSVVAMPVTVTAVDLVVSQNKVALLSCKGLSVDAASRTVPVNKQLFIKLPARGNLVFAVQFCGASREEGTSYLSSEYLSSVALSISQLKTVHLKPLTAGLKVRLDFVVPTFVDGPISDSSLDTRYEKLLGEVRQLRASAQGASSTPAPSITFSSQTGGGGDGQQIKRRIQTAGRRSRRASAVDNENQIKWEGKTKCCVINVLVKVGSPLMRGTPLMEVEVMQSLTDSDDKSDGFVDRGYGASDDSGLMGGTGYATSLLLPRPSATPSYGSAQNLYLHSSSDSATARNATETIYWAQDTVGKVVDVSVEANALVDPGSVLLTADTSSEAQQLAFLTLADQAGMKARAGNVSAGGGDSLNNRFQKLAERLSSSVSQSEFKNQVEVVRTCGELERVARNFFEIASRYGQVIISEMHMPVEQKTVRPLKMGGVLGGHKFMVRGVLFKFADGETFSNYPDPLHIANKVQGHELKGLKAYFSWFFNRGLLGSASFPLAAVIDYKGHRITALAVLPVSGSTSLIYGSDNAGTNCDVKMLDAQFCDVVMRASCGLNLAKHYAVNGRAGGGEVQIASCVDLEGHRGHDLRHYMLDFSRTFPPAMRDQEKKQDHDNMWIFYHMLRPELVSRWEKPLCADAFSNFQSPKREAENRAHNQEVRAATTWVETEGVLRVARALLNASDSGLTNLSQVFHSLGVNLRYIGLVYAQLVATSLFDASRQSLYSLILCEGCARVFKAKLRSELRAVKSDDESELAAVCASTLNRLFAHCPSQAAWQERNKFVAPFLMQYFGFDERGARAVIENFYQSRSLKVVDFMAGQVTRTTRYIVLARLDERVGLGLSQRILTELQMDGKAGLGMRSWSSSSIFEDSDINFCCKVKNLDIVERATSIRYYLQALSEGLVTEEPLMKAFACLESALQGMPSDVGFLTLFGDVNKALFELFEQKDSVRSALFKERAETSYKQAAQLDDKNPRALMRYGLFLNQIESNLGVAEDKLLAAAELFCAARVDLGQELVLALVGLLDKRNQKEHATQMRQVFLPLQHAMVREPSVLSEEGKDSTWLRGKMVSKILRHKPCSSSEDVSSVAADERLMEGYLLKRKKGNEKMTTKKRWMVLTTSGELRYFVDAKGRLLGSIPVQGSSVSLEDPVLSIEVTSDSGSVTVYHLTCDSEGPSVMRWHDALVAVSGKSPRFVAPLVQSHNNILSGFKTLGRKQSTSK